METNTYIMVTIEVLFFDVLETIVDFRSSIDEDIAAFLRRHDLPLFDVYSFADAWV